VPGQVFPQEPLAQGEERETAVGFWVAPRAGTGPVTLRWTSGGRTAVLPLDQVPTGA
jgi:hypothetical protein